MSELIQTCGGYSIGVILNPEGVKNPRPKGGRPFAEFILSEAEGLRVTWLKRISLNQFSTKYHGTPGIWNWEAITE